MARTNLDKSPVLARKLLDLPTRPGVYLYRDREENLLYVGKAKVLRNRVKRAPAWLRENGSGRRIIICKRAIHSISFKVSARIRAFFPAS